MYDHFSNISYLVLEAGTDCNLKCSFCPREKLVLSGNRPKKVMTLKEYDWVLSKFDENNIDYIKLHGLSEAMMVPKFDQYVSLVRKHQPNSHITLITNGQYRLKSSPLLKTSPFVNEIWFSVDGVEQVYESERKGSKWDKIIKLWDDLSCNDNFEEIRKKVYFQFTLSESNYKDLPKVYKILHKYGFKGVRFNLVQNWEEDSINNHKFSDDAFNVINTYKKDLKGVGGWQFKDCFWVYEGIFIDAYGDIRHCIMNYTMQPIGNMFKDNVKQLYNEGSVYENARSSLSRNCPPKQCVNCDYNYMSETFYELLGRGESRQFRFVK